LVFSKLFFLPSPAENMLTAILLKWRRVFFWHHSWSHNCCHV